MSLGILAGSLVFGPVVDRFGYRSVLVAGALGVGLGLAAIACLPTPTLLTPAMLVFGCGGGLLNGATNALVADITPAGREAWLALLGVFFGIGAFGVPLILGLLLQWMTYTAIVGGLAILVVVPLVDFVAVRLRRRSRHKGSATGHRGDPGRSAAALGRVAVILPERDGGHARGMKHAGISHEVLGLGQERSILVLSLFWVGMVAARLVLTQLLRFEPQATISPGSWWWPSLERH